MGLTDIGKSEKSSVYWDHLKFDGGGRSQDGGGVGRVITVSSTNSLKEQQNGKQSLQNNFWSLAADIRRPEKQSIVFEGR